MDLGSGVGWGFLRNSQNKSLQLIQSLKHQARAARFFSKASSPPPIVFFIYLFRAKKNGCFLRVVEESNLELLKIKNKTPGKQSLCKFNILKKGNYEKYF